MPNPTPAQVAALAQVVRITPETHPWLSRNYCIGCGKTIYFDADSSTECCGDLTDTELSPLLLPDPLGPDADDVFAMRVFRWCQSRRLDPSVFNYEGKFEASIRCAPEDALYANNIEDTATLALIRACQSARVPEICAIFGEAEHDNA